MSRDAMMARGISLLSSNIFVTQSLSEGTDWICLLKSFPYGLPAYFALESPPPISDCAVMHSRARLNCLTAVIWICCLHLYIQMLQRKILLHMLTIWVKYLAH
jgi:hypothetical protein